MTDVFLCVNYKVFEKSIKTLTEKKDDLKSGLKYGIYFLIKKSLSILIGMYLIRGKKAGKKIVKYLRTFADILEYHKNDMFYDAKYANDQKRQNHLRKPKNIPIDGDIQKLKLFIANRIEELMKISENNNKINQHVFVELRDLCVTRLTLFNARRGGEVCRLMISEFQIFKKH